MNGNIVRHPSALRDLDEAADYIQRHGGADRAIRFLRQVDGTLQRLAALPRSGTPFDPGEPRFADLRYLPISRFKNYLVFYRPIDGGLEVLRVLHGSRDLGGILGDESDDDEASEDG